VRVAGDPAAVAARLNRSATVLYAEPNYIMRATDAQIPNDPRFGELYGLDNTGQSGGTPDADIDAPEGWGTAASLIGFPPADGGVKVGVVDTGIMASHEDLAGKVVDCAGVRSFGIILGLFANPTIDPGKCVDDNGHGTHVAGTIAARANNGKGITGVAFNSRLAICKALDSSGAGPVAGIANCITYLSQVGAKVISMSFGAPSTPLRARARTRCWSPRPATTTTRRRATRPPTRRSSRSPRPTATTRAPRSRTSTATWRSPRRASTSCRRGSTADT
jgi:thermitase